MLEARESLRELAMKKTPSTGEVFFIIRFQESLRVGFVGWVMSVVCDWENMAMIMYSSKKAVTGIPQVFQTTLLEPIGKFGQTNRNRGWSVNPFF